MICSVCSKQADEGGSGIRLLRRRSASVLMRDGVLDTAGSKFENDKLVCGSCVAEKGTFSIPLVIDTEDEVLIVLMPFVCRAERA